MGRSEQPSGTSEEDISKIEKDARENWQVFLETYDVQALHIAVDRARRVLDLRDPGVREWATFSAALTQMLSALYRHTGDQLLVEELVRTGEATLEALSPDDHLFGETKLALAIAHLAMYHESHDPARIDLAVQLSDEALALAITANSDRLGEHYLRSGAMLIERFMGQHSDEDLNDGIDKIRLAVLHSEGFPASISGRLADLGKTLMMRYARWGLATDAEEAVEAYRRALEMLPLGHPEHASHLSGLGGVLQQQYSLHGRLKDLDLAINHLRHAVGETPDGHPDHVIRTGRLASAILERSSRSRDQVDVDNAIELLEGILRTDILDPAVKRSAQKVLSSALLSRSGIALTEPLNDLRRAEELLDEALAASNPSSSEHLAIRREISRVQGTWYAWTSETIAAESATRGLREVVRDSPDDSPAHALTLLLLSELLLLRVEMEGFSPDANAWKEQARTAAKLAALHLAATPDIACASAMAWATASAGKERLAAYERAFELLPLLAPDALEVADSIHRLQSVSDLASAAASAYIEIGNVERAVEVLELGRAVSLNTRLRWGADVARLRQADPDLAGEYELLTARQVDTSSSHAESGAGEDEIRSLLAKIRRVPGFDSFALPRTYAELAADLPEGVVCYVNISPLRSDAIIVDQTGPRFIALPELDARQADIESERFRSAMRSALDSDDEGEIAEAESVARGVMAWLWEAAADPILAELGYVNQGEVLFDLWPRVWWIPTGALALLPLHAAGRHGEPDARMISTDETVLDRVVSSHLPSMEALRRARSAASNREEHESRGLIVAAREVEGEDRLPGVVEEVRQITKWVGRAAITLLSDATELSPDGSATRAEVLSQLHDATWVHFACHGGNDSLEPTRSELLLCGGPHAAIRVEDLLVPRAGAGALAYFSACSTAQIARDQADEPVHFGTAAVLMGFAHVIMTFWPVFDDPAVAGNVYSVLAREGGQLDESLSAFAVHAASHELRVRHGGRIHAWAAYVHQGA